VEDNDINPTVDLWYLNSNDIEPFDWYRRFFGGGRRGLGGDFLDDMLRGFYQLKREMEREFENIEKKYPKTR
jgi:HSP20 family protein